MKCTQLLRRFNVDTVSVGFSGLCLFDFLLGFYLVGDGSNAGTSFSNTLCQLQNLLELSVTDHKMSHLGEEQTGLGWMLVYKSSK